MSKLFVAAVALTILTTTFAGAQTSATTTSKPLATLVDSFFEAELQYNPTYATFIGDNRYNDQLYIEFTDSHRNRGKQMYQRYLNELARINRAGLNAADGIEYDVLKRTLQMNLERLSLTDYLIPFNQFRGLPNQLAIFGSGGSAQPFKTVQDYDNWLRRASVFGAWADSAIVYFRKGMAQGVVMPKTLVEKVIPQLGAHVGTEVTRSVFYSPISKLPANFSEGEKQRLTAAFTQMITGQLSPAYQRLRDFLQNEYLPKARTTSGYGVLPNGAKLYDFYIRNYTTTNKSANEIFNIGLAEVARIRKEMETVKAQVGFTGDLKSFFEYMRTDPKFYPYKTEEEILNYYRNLKQRIDPTLQTMFNNVPKTPFEVRAVEAFRAATAAASYSTGSLQNNRPGIFYVPIVDATKTQARESLFLHEAIPGHHYQISLQNENEQLSKFRRHTNNSAYAEGWGLYAESLGKELGLYTDPYQYMLALGDEMHRAVRLVVDAGMHAKGWTREQAIQYSLDNEPIEEQRAVSEIERYMAIPGQALSYKIGELKIKELRARYEKQLGSAFKIAAFHDAILMDGGLPLDVLERKMDAWAKGQKK